VKKNILKVIEYLDFVPMTIFLLLFKTGTEWPKIFTLVGAISLFFMVTHFIFLKRKFAKPILLGVNLFFVVGFIMIVFNIEWLIFLYQSLMQGVFFGLITLVAFAATIFEPRAFLENKSVEIKLARKLSLMMGVGGIFATIFAWYFRGDFFYAGFVPFFGLFFLQDLIQVGDSHFKDRFLRAFLINILVLSLSFLLRGIIGANAFLSIVVLIVGKKLLRFGLSR
jgi:hypothetical protein